MLTIKIRSKNFKGPSTSPEFYVKLAAKLLRMGSSSSCKRASEPPTERKTVLREEESDHDDEEEEEESAAAGAPSGRSFPLRVSERTFDWADDGVAR